MDHESKSLKGMSMIVTQLATVCPPGGMWPALWENPTYAGHHVHMHLIEVKHSGALVGPYDHH